MKQGSNSRRSRGRGSNKRSSNRNNNHDSAGQEGRIRGNASQVYEKYLALARDALSADDRISSENYSQHAEHFYRIMTINAENQKNATNAAPNNGQNNEQNNEQTNLQKDRGKNQRSRKNSRANNRGNNRNIDLIVDSETEDKREKNQVIDEDSVTKTKVVKEIEIKSPTENQAVESKEKENKP